MTKSVRIENADSNNAFGVKVQVFDKTLEGDILVQEVNLINPADMTSGLYLTNTRYIVIKELTKETV